MSITDIDVPKGSILESDSPDPRLLNVERLGTSDYRTQTWKNGLGETSEIYIHPPDKDFKSDPFFWRLSKHVIEANCNFSVFPGYECTTIVLPNQGKRKNSTILLNHKGEEMSTTVKPLFPYTWNGSWPTSCQVSNPPVTNLQFVINRKQGTAQFNIEKIGQPVSNESGESGKNMLLGTFALLYVVEGNVRIELDENHLNGCVYTLNEGQTLFLERDEEASPTSIIVKPCDKSGTVGHPDLDATFITIQVAESKKAPSSVGDSAIIPPTMPIPTELGGQKRSLRRRSSLVVYDEQPIQNLKEKAHGYVVPEPQGELETNLRAPGLSSVDEGMRRDSIAMLQGTFDKTQLYTPPTFALMPQDTDVPPPVVRDRLVIEEFPLNTISTAWIKMVKQGLSEWIRLPAIVCRGSKDGPVVGITAALHGNELNGVPCIHRVVSEIDVKNLSGTVVAIPCVNMVGYLQFKREYADGRDLNRLFPGKEDGFSSQVYCYQLMNKVISQFNYLIDLHTASFGRINSYYVRADMNDSGSAMLAHLQRPQIVLHNSGQDGTLRSAAAARGIKAITVEIGNPQLFQNQYIQWSYMGVMRILDHLDMFPMDNAKPKDERSSGPPNTVLCSKGFWIYTKTGGVLEVYPGVNTIIRKGDLMARIKNIFGNVVDEYVAPCSGIVIGRSSNPVAMSGDRILHLGVIKRKGEVLPKEAKENY
ncbi:hypothetical protein LRAMOSA08679 [Lichtheimia ramosa]|uniref:Succinylglutamate desuccinylase/Aspartoacylase catalytic domain-containing protein n=1 Tax=Lichtheimia ramosa TaxID=688394 RepID=A0A077WEU9_9FUNG|nr:hypothetical protein LRAMOSA08679 [Lichtheimia ramosa]